MKIFFDVDGVLIDGWHANSALRKPWDAMLEVDLVSTGKPFESCSSVLLAADPPHPCSNA
jgi:FMN phosphatase YigB (HAD superfamily)